MKKIIALLLACMMVVGLFAACAPAGTGSTGSTEGTKGTEGDKPTEVKEITLSVWAPSEDLVEGGWMAQMQASFEKAHPEYKITWQTKPVSEGEAGKLVTDDPTAAADVFMFANDQLGGLMSANAIAQLGGDYLKQVQDDNNATLLSTVTYSDGKVYGFPYTNNTWFLYYNKEIFNEEDVKSLDTMLSKGKVAYNWNTGWYNGCFFLGNGGKLFGDNYLDGAAGIQFGKDNGGYETALKMIELAKHENMVNDENSAGNSGLKDGSIGAYFSGSWDYAGLKEALGDKLGAAQLPTFNVGGAEKQMMSFAGSKAVGVNRNAKNMVAAMQFAAHLASVDGQKLHYELRGIIPSAKALAEDEAVKSSIVAQAEINTMANTSVPQPVIPEMGNYWNPVQTFANNVYTGMVTADNYKEQVDLMMESLNGGGL